MPTPPQTPPSAASPVAREPVPDASLERLDNLLETYLELLDEYTTLRTQLSKQFSDAFFSLARANHTSASLGNGRRYGEEGYDQRMKAQRMIVYSAGRFRSGRDENCTGAEDMNVPNQAEKEDNAPAQRGYRISIQKTKDVSKLDQTSTEHPEQSKGAGAPDRPCTGDSATALTSSPSPTKTESCLDGKAKAKPPPSNRDPLNWYGILVPTPLRQAQASFVSAVETSIPQLLNTSASMYDLESIITKLRIALDLRPGEEADQDSDKSMRAQEQDSSTTSPSSQPSKPTEEAAHTSTSPRRRLFKDRPSPARGS
jgi:coiled-coil domain-containing protein 115